MKIQITKLLSNTITQQELIELNNWLKNPKNQSVLKTYILDLHDLNLTLLKNNIDDAFENVINTIEQSKPQTKVKPLHIQHFVKYAAVILIMVSIGYVLVNKNGTSNSSPVIVNNTIQSGTEKATLTLEDGTTIMLEKGQKYSTNNLLSTGEQIVYNEATNKNKEVVYNYLTVPRGGQYFVKLSDGTQVWLNSETKLKYPVTFIEGDIREVELVYGEAFFDVSSSTKNNGSSFVVKSIGQDIQVLGTQFNVKAYSGEVHISTTLVEGKVAVKTSNENLTLLPNQQSKLNTANNTLHISEVNVYNVVSWKDGIFSFKNKPLKHIMATLSRWYDMDVTFKNKKLEQVTFTGVIRKHQTIEQILSAIKSNSINNYKINNKSVTIE